MELERASEVKVTLNPHPLRTKLKWCGTQSHFPLFCFPADGTKLLPCEGGEPSQDPGTEDRNPPTRETGEAKG